mgnify:CR=1 FL=1
MTMAFAGHGATHAPQPLQVSSTTSGTNGPPMRGRKRIASSGQASRQLMQETPECTRQDSDMSAVWPKAATPSSKTGSGHAAAHSPQKVHSPDRKSIEGRFSTIETMSVGQESAHAPHDVQACRLSCVVQGGLVVIARLLGSRPEERRAVRKLRLLRAASVMINGLARKEDLAGQRLFATSRPENHIRPPLRPR